MGIVVLQAASRIEHIVEQKFQVIFLQSLLGSLLLNNLEKASLSDALFDKEFLLPNYPLKAEFSTLDAALLLAPRAPMGENPWRKPHVVLQQDMIVIKAGYLFLRQLQNAPVPHRVLNLCAGFRPQIKSRLQDNFSFFHCID